MFKSSRHLFVLAIAVLFITLTGCAMEGGTARVTIDTGLGNPTAIHQVSIFDRILAFLSYSTAAQADPAPGTVDSITISVTGDGVSGMTNIPIPRETGRITLEVPAGSNRTFTVIGWDPTPARLYGGIKTVDLAGGMSTNLTIKMGLLPDPPDSLTSSGNFPAPVVVIWDYTTPPSEFSSFVIYRARTSAGPYTPILSGRKEDFDTGSDYRYTDDAQGFSQYDYIYYKISAKNQYGEGNMSSYRTHYWC